MRLIWLSGLCGLCFGMTQSLSADELGRLFSTPAERARIEAQRAGQLPLEAPEPAATVDRLVLNGILTGSDGKRLAWLNGKPLNPDAVGSDLTLLYDGRARLHWRGGTAARTLKPGQVVDTATGEVFELYSAPDHAAKLFDAAAPTEPSQSN